MAQLNAKVEDHGPATIDVWQIVAGHMGPACLFNASRQPVAVNSQWLDAGLPGPDGTPDPDTRFLPGQLAVDLADAASSARPGRSVVRQEIRRPKSVLGVTGVEAVFEFTILPVANRGDEAFLVLGADRTAFELLSHALTDSREFHRAFVACSTDFVWQVDAAGIIDYTGPRGFLDHSPDKLFGTPIASYFSDVRVAEASLVFQSREPMWEREVWLSDARGMSHCFLVSSVPVVDQLGHWQGARGVGREITEQREREAELKKARFSQRMIDSVLHAMRSEVDPRAILDAATIVAADSAKLDACLVAGPDIAGKLNWVAKTLPAPEIKAVFDEISGPILDRMKTAIGDNARSLVWFTSVQVHFLVAVTSVDGTPNGAIAFCRGVRADEEPGFRSWSPEDEHILRAMAEQLGVSLAQYELVETLRRRTES